MKVDRLRRILGDVTEPYQWSDSDLSEWVLDADPFDSEYTIAADILSAHYSGLVLSGAGTSVRSDDITVNDYNNLVLLRERITDLRSRGAQLSTGGFALEFPYD